MNYLYSLNLSLLLQDLMYMIIIHEINKIYALIPPNINLQKTALETDCHKY